MTFLYWLGRTTAESVVIKLDRYLLDPEHLNVRGNLTGKAIWFRNNLGFTRHNAGELAKQIKFYRSSARLAELTKHGPKYYQVIKILGMNGKSKNIEFIWIKNVDGVVRLVGVRGFPKYEGELND